MPNIVKAYAAAAATEPLDVEQIERREPGAKDVAIKILYCGVCHSDIHQARNEWQNTVYPCVPGHEIAGIVTAVGDAVTTYREGDVVAVGCLVDSCRTCRSCRDNLEQHCEKGPVFTYNGPDKHSGGTTYGGYSQAIVVDEAFVLRVPSNLDLAGAAPLLCAGITTYSPLRQYGIGAGCHVGVVGLGGLGHMAVKFAHAMGATVAVFTRSAGKVADARRLGADDVILSTSEADMGRHVNRFDLIIDTVSADHDINAYLNLVKRSGAMVLVGAPEKPLTLVSFSLIMQRRQLAGSLIGGLRETQEMLDFCGEHNIVCDIEMIGVEQINEAYDRILRSDVKYRFVIDMASLH